MSIQETLKTLNQLPEYIQNIWADVRDLGISCSMANSRSTKYHKEMQEKIDLLSKSYIELFQICGSRFVKVDKSLEAITQTINSLYELRMHGNDGGISETRMKMLLRDHMDNINVDLDHHDITCTSEDAINGVQTEVEDLSLQVQDMARTMNEGLRELRDALNERNWSIEPGHTMSITITAKEKE